MSGGLGTRFAIGLFAAASIAGVAFVRSRKAPPLEVEIVAVDVGTVRDLIPASSAGEVKPKRRVTLRSEIAGTVQKVLKRRGERVKEAELLATFDGDELLARKDQALANLDSAKIAEDIAKTRNDTADRALSRAKTLHAGGAISDSELDRAETEARAASQAVQQAASLRKQAEAALKLAQVSLTRTEVRAPFAGVLQESLIEAGIQLTPGASLFDLIDDSALTIEIPFDESDATRVTVGLRVSLTVESARGSELWGTVSYVPPAMGKVESLGLDSARVGKKDRSLYVEVTPDDPSAFRIGASVNAELLALEKSNVLFVPSSVVIGRGLERDVYLSSNGKAKKTKVRAGLTSWERTEILSGLSRGDHVIANLDLDGLEDGAIVRERSAAP